VFFPLNPNSVKSCRIENYKDNYDGVSMDYQEIIITLEKDFSDDWAKWHCAAGLLTKEIQKENE